MDEYFLPTLGMLHNLVIVIPSNRKLNTLAYISGMGYFLYKVYVTYGAVKQDLVVVAFLSWGWFILSNILLNSKLRTLYSILLKWEKLMKETKKILQIFPHGVIITNNSNSENKKWFSNQEFDRNICHIREKLDELNQVEVSFKASKPGRQSVSVTSGLRNFLINQENKVKFEKKMIEIDATVTQEIDSSGSSLNMSVSDKPFKRSYHVKSLKVDWEGFNSFLHVFIDTTNIIKLEEAKNNIKCQQIMFTSASHEFRTPLNAIVNSYQFIGDMFEDVVGVFQKPSSSKKDYKFIVETATRTRKFIKMGKNSSILLLALVEDILDLSKMEAGTFKVNCCDFKIGELIDEVHDIFSMQCEQKMIRLCIDVDPCLEVMPLWSDKSRIKQVLLNLMSNSVKFTFEGSITLSVSVQSDSFVEFWVEDTGIGIKQEDLSKLFILFGMIADSENLNSNGTGIGLTVCQKYLNKLGGSIQLESRFGEGTRVKFWIPIDKNKPLSRSNRFDKVDSLVKRHNISHLNLSQEGMDNLNWSIASENVMVTAPFSKMLKFKKFS